MRRVRVTVAICTHNRAHYLGTALASVVGHADDVLVVDNASIDATKDVVSAYAGARYVLEEQLGLSHARNRALAEATGDVVAFLDDDAVAVDGWAQRHAAAYDDERVAATGGPIRLVWPRTRPPWMPAALEGFYAGLDLGTADRDFAPSE